MRLGEPHQYGSSEPSSARLHLFLVAVMYLLYLDDSGSAENKDEDYLVLGGISVFERQVSWLSRDLDQLASRIAPTDPDGLEFHASEIWAGRAAPWKNMERDERRDVIEEVLDILARSHSSTRVFACAVHKASFPNSDPMEIAFEDLCSRFNLLLKRLFIAEEDRQRGIIIMDKSSYETSLQRLAHDFRTLGTRWDDVLVNIPEVPLFVESKNSRMLQLADHVAYATFRMYQSDDRKYFKIILPRFDAEEGKIHGLTHKQALDRHCMCPACLTRRLA